MSSPFTKLISAFRPPARPSATVVSQLPTCEERLRHAETIGFLPKVIFDCGAFIGRWARDVHEIFPSAQFVLVEPNHGIHDRILENTTRFQNNVHLRSSAVSDKQGTTFLNVWKNEKHKDPTTALAASSLQTHVQGDPTLRIEVSLETIDDISCDTGLVPDLLKLDLQGHELPALRGAERTLQNCEMVITEFGCLDAYVGRTTPSELFQFLYERDFVLYDIVDIRYRPYDGALTGGDFFFLKRNSPLKTHKDYF